MRPTNSVIYGTVGYTLQAIRCCASYILLNRLGLGIIRSFYAINTREIYILLSRLGLVINIILWIPLRSYNDTQFVAVALFVVTLANVPKTVDRLSVGLEYVDYRVLYCLITKSDNLSTTQS